MAAYSGGVKIEQLVTQPLVTLGLAMATFSAQNLGSGRLDRVQQGIRSALLLCILFSALASGLVFLFGKQLALLFIEPSEQQVVAQTVQYLHIISYFFIPLGLIFVFRNTCQGLGSGLIPMLSSIQELIFRALVAVTLPPVLGYVGICLSSPIAWIAAALILVVAYKLQYTRLSRLLKRVEDKPAFAYMLIYGYQSHGFQGSLIPIELVKSTHELTILGYSDAKQRELKLLLLSIFPSLPKATVQLGPLTTLQEMAAPLALALVAYEKHLLALQAPAVLCFGSLALGGGIRPSPSLRDIPTLCEQHGVGLVLVGRNSLLPGQTEGPQFCECSTLMEAGSQLCRYSLQHQGQQVHHDKSPAREDYPPNPFANIIGLKQAKQALIYAAAGNLPLLLYGPPGTGKTLLLSRVASLLPPLDSEAQQQISAMHGRPVEKRPVFSIPLGMRQADLAKVSSLNCAKHMKGLSS